MRATLPLILGLFVLAAWPEVGPGPVPATAAPETTVDASGTATRQPNPNGGDTPSGAAGMEGQSPRAAEAVHQGDPSALGTTAPPR